jgi:hypothetical protein
VISEILLFLKVSLNQATGSKDNGHYLLEGIKSTKIEAKLNRLMEKAAHSIVDKVEEVLFLMNHLGQELKDKYELDIEI